MSKWEWQDFDYISLKNGMDSRRAAFLLYDFLNMFEIDTFQIVSTEGNFQNQSISIVYVKPFKHRDDEIEDLWYEHLEKLKAES